MSIKELNTTELLTPGYIFQPDITIDKHGMIFKDLPDENSRMSIGTFDHSPYMSRATIKMVLYSGPCLMDETPLNLYDVFSPRVLAEKDGTLTVKLGPAYIEIGRIDDMHTTATLSYQNIRGYFVAKKKVCR